MKNRLHVQLSSNNVLGVVVVSSVQTDFQCNPSFHHLAFVKCVYCARVSGQEGRKQVSAEVREQEVEKVEVFKTCSLIFEMEKRVMKIEAMEKH